MGTRRLHAVCSLAAVALLGACATNGVHASPATTAKTSPTTAAATASVAPLGSHTEKWISLQVGDCVADLPPADLSRVTVTVIDCTTAHLAEVYLRAPMAVDTAISTVANRDCTAGFAPTLANPWTAARFRSRISSTRTRIGPVPIRPRAP
jgi:hypothetical protein